MIASLLFQSTGSGDSSAVDPTQVTGWDVAGAVAIAVLAVPVGAVASRVAMRMLRRVPGVPDSIINDVGRLVKWLVYLIAFAIAMTFLGVTVGWLSIVVVVILIMALLMVKPMVENIAAGMLMTMRPAFAVGDQIQTDKYRGTVEEIGSRTTTIDTSDGVMVHIPNVEVAGEVIEVYSASESRKSSVSFNVAFTTDLDNLTALLLKSMATIDLVEKDPAPSVQGSGFEDGAITIQVGFWYASSHSSDSTPMDAVVRSIQSTLTEAGIAPVANRIAVEESRQPEESSQPSAVSNQVENRTQNTDKKNSGADAPTPDAKTSKSPNNDKDSP